MKSRKATKHNTCTLTVDLLSGFVLHSVQELSATVLCILFLISGISNIMLSAIVHGFHWNNNHELEYE